MIIHVTGPSGSGKTTLMHKFKSFKSFSVVDTDEIDDKHAMQLYADDKIRDNITFCNMDPFFKQKDQMNRTWLKTFAKSHKNIIIFGLAFGIIKSADYKFCIKIDSLVLHTRLQIRTLDAVVAAASEIKKLFKSGVHPELIKFLAIHKYYIRTDIISPYCPVIDYYDKYYERMKRHGYQCLEFDVLFRKIEKLLK